MSYIKYMTKGVNMNKIVIFDLDGTLYIDKRRDYYQR